LKLKHPDIYRPADYTGVASKIRVVTNIGIVTSVDAGRITLQAKVASRVAHKIGLVGPTEDKRTQIAL
jgi:hypothetical protein